MSEIVIPRPDPMEEIDQLRAELEVAMEQGQRLQDFTRAKNIRVALDQKITDLKNLIDPWQYNLRQNIAKEMRMDFVGHFNEFGTTRARRGRNEYIINSDQKVLRGFNANNDLLRPFSDGFFSTMQRHFHYYDYAGETKIEVTTKNAESFSNGVAKVTAEVSGFDQDYFIDRSGRLEFSWLNGNYSFSEALNFSEDKSVAMVNALKKYVFLDKNGKILPLGMYDLKPSGFGSGFASVPINNVAKRSMEWKFINADGKIMNFQTSTHRSEFVDSHAIIYGDESINVYDTSGELRFFFDLSAYSYNLEAKICANRLMLNGAEKSYLYSLDGYEIIEKTGKLFYADEGIFGIISQERLEYIDNYGRRIFS